MIYRDRYHAGDVLTGLISHSLSPDAAAVGLTRGGVAVASAIASKLNLPLYTLVVKKVPHPTDNELAIGAVTEDCQVVLSQLVNDMGVSHEYVDVIVKRKMQEAHEFQQTLPPLPSDLSEFGQVILVDDGIATGASMDVAITWALTHYTKTITVAAPVGPETFERKTFPKEVQVLIPLKPLAFHSVGDYYQNFGQVTDREVVQLMRERRCLDA